MTVAEVRQAILDAGTTDPERVAEEELALRELAQLEGQWQADRLAVVYRAEQFISAGRVHLGTVLRVLGVSPRSWARRKGELRAALAGTSLPGIAAAGDRAEAAAAAARASDWGATATHHGHSKWQEGQA